MSHHFIVLLYHNTHLSRLERRPSFIWGSVGQWCGLFQPELHPCSGKSSTDQDAESLDVCCAGVRGSAGGVAFEGWGGVIKQVCTAVKAWGNLACVFLLMFENNWESQRGNI